MSSALDTAMILAAGLGTRMRPLTDSKPKPLVELAGRTLLDRVLDRLDAAGFHNVIVNVHYQADTIEAAIARRTSPKVTISDERDELLDTGGGVRKALPLLGEAPVLIHNSDSIWIDGVEDNLVRLKRAWDPERMDCLMLLALSSSSIGFDGPGDFHMSSAGALTRRAEQDVAPFVFAGVSIAHPRMFQDTPAGAFSLNILWDRAIARQRLYGIRLEGYWMHVGSPSALAAAEHAISTRAD
ncbi:MAG: nucleotidyltransferase family protein [Hyphomicrobiaceae bacterium]